MEVSSLPSVSVVIIGLNEERQLAHCIESVLASTLPPVEVIYVDGGSTDRSVEIAKGFPITVVELHPSHPTPGLGRNEGLHRCQGEFVQFVDGDMTVEADWLRQSVPFLADDERTACVCGRTVTMNPSQTIYNSVLSVMWEAKPLGEVMAPGNGGLFRARLLRNLGGYADYLVAGEEPELGDRIRRAGYRIVALGIVMGFHDLDVESFAQYWRRGMRHGIARAQLMERSPEARFSWSLLKGDVYVVAALSMVLVALLLRRFELIAFLLLLGTLMVCRQGWIYYRRIGSPCRCLLFGLHLYFSMVPSLVGRIRYSLRLLR